MSKQYKFEVSISAEVGKDFGENFLKGVEDLKNRDDRGISTVTLNGDKLFISIGAKDINMTRSIVSTYLNMLKTLGEVDSL